MNRNSKTRPRLLVQLLATAVLAATAAASTAVAAEMRFRAECRPSGPVVTLGDLAEVLATDPDEARSLATLELFPSPPPGERRFVDARQIQDLLLLRGMGFLEHRFTGAGRVAISSPSTGGPNRWAGQRAIASPAPPSATVEGEPAVVVAARTLARGSVIGPNDVRLERRAADDELADGFAAIEGVLGQEVTRAIPAGVLVLRDSVRPPLLVRRGEAVTVLARSPGVRVRSTARARDDGGLGDLIAVESSADRKTFLGRVSGVQEVEVYGRAIRSGPAAGEFSPSAGGAAN